MASLFSMVPKGAGPSDTCYDSGTPSEDCNDNHSAAKD